MGTDGSEACATLLEEVGLSLKVLQDHRHRGALLGHILRSWGSSEAVLAGLQENRNRFATLLQATLGDQQLGRMPELVDALQMAIGRNQEAEGRILLRALAAPSPNVLPEGVPLLWLHALRDIPKCAPASIDKVLGHMEAAGEEEETPWGVVDWRHATGAQVRLASKLLRRWSKSSLLRSAELTGREAMQRQLEVQGQVIQTLNLLPLGLLDESARKELLLSPELPAQATSLLALQAAESAEARARQLSERLEETERHLQDQRRISENLRRDVQELDGKVSRLQTKISK